MITFQDIEPATKIISIYILYIYLRAALMLSVFGVCLVVLCVSFLILSLQTLNIVSLYSLKYTYIYINT
jgi:hypothetical protein